MPGLVKQIASKAGVAVPTVYEILRGQGRSSQETRKRVLEAAKLIGYRPLASARAIATRRSKIIGALLFNTRFFSYDYSVMDILMGANAWLQSQDYVLSIVSVADVMAEGNRESRVFRERLLDGVLVIGRMFPNVEARVDELSTERVYAETDTWHRQRCVRRDEVQVGQLAASKLAEAGYKYLLWIGPVEKLGPPPLDYVHFSALERHAGVRKVASAAGLRLEDIHLDMSRPATWDASVLHKHVVAGAGIVAFNHEVTHWLIDAGLRLNREAGVDYGLASCDSFDIERTLPAVSRVEFHRFNLGVRAAQMLLAVLAEPKKAHPSEKLRSEWVEGQTCRRRGA